MIKKSGLLWHARTLLLLASLSAPGFAVDSTLRGTVINGTTERPAVGDEVVLLKLSSDGMAEETRTTTDRTGHFALPVSEMQELHLIRVIHQGITYHESVQPGTTSVALKVYDVGRRLEGIAAVMDVERFEATEGTLEIKQLVTVRNSSSPPRTLMNDRSFEFLLSPEAEIQSALVQVANGEPLKQSPVPSEPKGRYYFTFPIRPGDTRFAITYRVPYHGQAVIEPVVRNPLERFVIMLPKTMRFDSVVPGKFRSLPGITPDNVQGTTATKVDDIVAFRITGVGSLEELRGRRKAAEEPIAATTPAPGGGLGPPIEAPDPLHAQRWFIFSGLVVVLTFGSIYVTKTRRIRRC